MKTFKTLLSEEKSTSEDIKILADLKDKIKTLPDKAFNTKHKWHLRFSVGNDVAKYFKQYGYTVSDADISLSGMYATYIIKSNLGTAHFVNQTRSNSSIKTKELAPDKFDVTGSELTAKAIIDAVKSKVPTLKYSDGIKNLLIDLIEKSNTKGNKILVNAEDISAAELATISADFGELCCAVWAIKNIGFKRAFFPEAINEPLVDFYGVLGSLKYPISVKSGGGSATSIKNISDLIKEKLEDEIFIKNFSANERTILDMIVDMNEMPVMDGFIHAHVLHNTPAIKELSKVSGISSKNISPKTLQSWLSGKQSKELKPLLTKFYELLGNNVDDKTWKRYDQKTLTKSIGVLIGPMGHSIVKLLNSKESSKILTKVARQITLLQMNVDIKSKTLQFKREKFKNYNFEFKWQGGAPNPNRNKLGFKAVVK